MKTCLPIPRPHGRCLTTRQLNPTREGGDSGALHIALPATAPDERDSVIVLDIEGVASVDTGLLQQPDGVVTLFSYLGDLHPPAGTKTNVDSRGVVAGWTAAGRALAIAAFVVLPPSV